MSRVGQGPGELPAGADAELGEHLTQMPLDRARAQEQLGADLGIGQPVPGPPGDLPLLRGELVRFVRRALADGLPGGEQLAAGTFGERLGSHPREHVVGRPQLGPGVGAPVLPPEPFPVDQVRTGQGDRAAALAQPADRLAVELLGGFALTYQRARARLDAQPPGGAAGARRAGQPLDGVGGTSGLTAADGRLGQLGQPPVGEAQLLRVGAGLVGGAQRVLVAAESVAEHRAGVPDQAEAQCPRPGRSGR